jgi:hypothetical protein
LPADVTLQLFELVYVLQVAAKFIHPVASALTVHELNALLHAPCVVNVIFAHVLSTQLAPQ